MLYRCLAVFLTALVVSCGGGTTSTPTPAIADGSHALRAGISTEVFGRLQAPRQALAAAHLVDSTNLMDWAEMAYPQYFPSHRVSQTFAPYVFRYYPETSTYLAVEGQYVRVLGPAFGPDILTVGVLTDFVCQVFPEACAPPIATAGAAQQVLTGATVTLQGSGLDGNGASLNYSWSLLIRPPGSGATLANANSATAQFVADVAGTYEASLVVSNGISSSSPATVVITAAAANVAPVADAGGSRSVTTASGVHLSGTLSYDANGDSLTYAWTFSKPSGSNAVLQNATTASPYFTPDVSGTYVATLIVSDGKTSSQPASVSITATSVSTYCCKHCTTGKPCGDSCISRSYTCHVGAGCACY